MDKYILLEELLTKRFEQEKYRQLRPLIPVVQKDKNIVTNFSSHDFLGLTDHVSVKKKSIEYVLEWGAGSSSTRVLMSHIEAQDLLQKRHCQFLEREGALFFPSTHVLLNHLFSAFAHNRSIALIDSSLNLSYKQAALSMGVQPLLFHHNDVEDLEERIEKHKAQGSLCLIIVEALSEVEGDFANLEALSKVAKRNGAFLCVEETCTFGVYGKNGRGLAYGMSGVDLVFGKFNKTSGEFGSFLCAKRPVIDLITHCCELYSPLSPLPPAALGAIDALLELIAAADDGRTLVASHCNELKQVLVERLWPVEDMQGHLFTLSLPDSLFTQMLSKLYSEGIFVSTVRPALGRKRIKFTTTADHMSRDFERLKEALITNEPQLESSFEPALS